MVGAVWLHICFPTDGNWSEKLSIRAHPRMKAGRFFPHVIEEKTGSVTLNDVLVTMS